MRTHMIEMNETQMSRVLELLRADMFARPADYADDNDLTYLVDCFASTVAMPADEYDRNMLHDFTS